MGFKNWFKPKEEKKFEIYGTLDGLSGRLSNGVGKAYYGKAPPPEMPYFVKLTSLKSIKKEDFFVLLDLKINPIYVAEGKNLDESMEKMAIDIMRKTSLKVFGYKLFFDCRRKIFS
jgi:hypothetical protein